MTRVKFGERLAMCFFIESGFTGDAVFSYVHQMNASCKRLMRLVESKFNVFAKLMRADFFGARSFAQAKNDAREVR